MPNLGKAKYKAAFVDIDLEFVWSGVHRYYLDGLHAAEQAGMSEYRQAEARRFLEKVEGVLVNSGYVQQWEIDLRHKEKDQQAARMKHILDPYNLGG